MELTSLDGRSVFWKAEPKQNIALSCPAFEVLYGGQKGGMKSETLCVKPAQILFRAHEKYKLTGEKQERCRIVIFRRNLKHLTDLITRAKEIYSKLDTAAGIGGWNKNEKRFTFTSGAFVEFDHLDGPDDHQGYNGQEIRGICIDQCEEIPGEVVQFLKAQIRTSDPDYADLLFLFMTANPGGRHAQWVKDYFIKSCPPNKIISTTIKLKDGRTKDTTRAFIPSALADNPYLNTDGQYEANLRTLPEHMQKMYLDGDWDAVVGAFFAHVWRKDIHVIPSFPISAAWEVKGGLDWGASAPACWLIGAKDGEGDVYIIDEVYGPGITGRQFGARCARKVREQLWSAEKKWALDDFYSLVDYHAFNRLGGEGMTAGDGLMAEGLRLFDCIKDRAAGNEQIIERLLLRPNGNPRLYIFGDRCPNLVRTLPNLRGDPNKPDDVDSSQEDHCLAGDTIVNTISGPQEIRDLVGKSGVAYGAMGEKVSFSNVRLTRHRAPVMRVKVSDGRFIVCTRDHLLMTEKGWRPAGSLTLQDRMHSVTVPKWTQKSNRPPCKHLMESDSIFVDSISSGGGSDCIGRSGPGRTDQSPTDTMSITSTTTAPTIVSQTSLSSRSRSISLSTDLNRQSAPVQPGQTTPGSMRQLGTQELPLTRGRPPPPKDGRRSPDQQSSASPVVATSQRHSPDEPSIAARPVAFVAIESLDDLGIEMDVYDLDVDSDDHAFVVSNGLVVHNCYDSLRYLLMDWRIDREEKRDSRDLEVERWLRLAKNKKRQTDGESHIHAGYGS